MTKEKKDVDKDTHEFILPAQETIGINITDLQTVVNLIDTASQRGAFRANELMMIGTVYNKIVTFIQAATISAEQQGELRAPTPEEHNTAMAALNDKGDQ